MTRENKLALIVGFSLILVVGVLISDHFSRVRKEPIGNDLTAGTAQNFGAAGLTNPIGPAPVSRTSPPLVRIDDTAPASAESHATPRPPIDVPTTLRGTPKPVPVPDPAPGKKTPERPVTGPTEAPETGVAAATARKYEVKENDTYYKIAQATYGEAGLFRKLQEFNKAGDAPLKIGATILLPAKEVLTGKPAPASDVAQGNRNPLKDSSVWSPDTSLVHLETVKPNPKKEKEGSKPMYAMYTVKRGDDLSKIARSQLGSARRYQEIIDLNRDQIEDEESIREGITLKLPSK